jgi:hypothetical protein
MKVMLSFLTVFPVELRAEIASFLGAKELVRLALHEPSSLLSIFGDFPNRELERARKALKLHPILRSLGMLETPWGESETKSGEICCQWADAVGEETSKKVQEEMGKLSKGEAIIVRSVWCVLRKEHGNVMSDDQLDLLALRFADKEGIIKPRAEKGRTSGYGGCRTRQAA